MGSLPRLAGGGWGEGEQTPSLPQPLQDRRHVHLIALVVAGQCIHPEVHAEPVGERPLPRPTRDHGIWIAPPTIHRPGRRPVVAADDHRTDAVIRPILVTLHPNGVAGVASGEVL